MNNAVYGKTMGNLKKRIKIRVTKNSQDFIKYTSRPTCVNWKAFKNNLAATLRSQKLTLDYYLLTLTQTVYVMNFMKKFIQKMCKYKELFDLCNVPVSSKYYCSDNKKVVGKMKDEYGGKQILKFVDLKSKMYLILDESNNEKYMLLQSFQNFTIHYLIKRFLDTQ